MATPREIATLPPDVRLRATTAPKQLPRALERTRCDRMPQRTPTPTPTATTLHCRLVSYIVGIKTTEQANTYMVIALWVGGIAVGFALRGFVG